MRHTFLFLCLLLLTGVSAQNLVPNPSFEEYSECPDNQGQIERSIDWYSFNGTPDYFNTCGTNELIQIPFCTGWGYQEQFDGNAYAGFIGMLYNNDREILGCQLAQPLEIGQPYFVTLNVSRTFGGGFTNNCDCGNNWIGARFLTQSYDPDNSAPIDNIVHVGSDELVVDTVGWVNISGWFVADSAYTHLAIGVFHDLDQLEVVNFNQYDFLKTYYYLDGICVSSNPSDCQEYVGLENDQDELLNPLHIFPNPALNQLRIESKILAFNLQVRDLQGRIVNDYQGFSQLQILDLSQMEVGMYVLTGLFSDGQSFSERFIKQ